GGAPRAAGGPPPPPRGEPRAPPATTRAFANSAAAASAARAALIEEAGGREWTADEARRQHTIAIEALDAVDMPHRVRDMFTALADFVVVRKR
ncbi:polyprenyl synthetase family protein, partial [Streptomyces olivaceus]